MFNKLVDGLYFSYQSLANQLPDRKIEVEMKDETVRKAKYQDENGNWLKVRSKDVYAIVYDGIPYIASEHGYFPVEKINNDFYFTLTAKVGPGTGEAVAMGVLFGLLGTLILYDFDSPTKSVEMKIDHLTGRFVALPTSYK